jgi:hypothetical protein
MINTQPKTAEAIRSLDPHSEFSIREGVITWITTPIDETKIATEMARLKTIWDSQDYVRKRKAEYPTIAELVVALYDTQDRAEIDKRRADVKKKYPKE